MATKEYVLNLPKGAVVLNSRKFVAMGPAKIKGKETGMVESFDAYVIDVIWRRKIKQGHQLVLRTEDGQKAIMFTNTIIEQTLCDVVEADKKEQGGSIKLRDGVAGGFYHFRYMGEGGKGGNIYHNVVIARSPAKSMDDKALAEAKNT